MALSLKERLALKRASAEAPPAPPAPEQKVEAPQPAPAPPVAPSAPSATASRPMSFAEKLAAKKAAAAAVPLPVIEAPAPASVEQKVEEKPIGPLSFADKIAAKKAAIAQAVATPQPEQKPFVMDPDRLPEDPALAQDFMDISKRIYELESLMEDDLKSSMSELKAALKKNPAASELLLHEDIGKMVAALYKMRNITMVAAEKKPSTKKPKAKEVALTAEQIAAAWDEL